MDHPMPNSGVDSMGKSQEMMEAGRSQAASAHFAQYSHDHNEMDVSTEHAKKKSPNGWKTTPYILGNEVSERIAVFALTWSLVLYLVRNYNMTGETAAYILSVSSGVTGLTPLLGGFLADTYLGRYRTIVIGSFAYLLGMVCLTLTAMVPGLTPEPCSFAARKEGMCEIASKGQLTILYTSLVLMAIGAGGLRPCSYAFGADQFKQETEHDLKQLQSFFNWYYVGVMFALLMSSTLLAYLQLEVSWTWGFGVPTSLMVVSIIVFLSGSPLYTYVAPSGSPIIELAQVVVASFRKRNVPLPSDPSKLHLADVSFLVHTPQFTFLDKAAVKCSEPGDKESKWQLCGLSQVESLKCILRVAPIWASAIIPGAYLVQQGAWVPLQAATMNRRLGSTSFHIPDSSVSVFSILATMLFLPFYDRVVMPFFKVRRLGIGRWKTSTRGITQLQRIGFGYALLILSPVISGLVEARRRRTPGGSHHMSVLWLALQLVVFGVAEGLNIVGQLEYLYKEMPPHMRSMSGAMFSCGMALGSFSGSFILASAQSISDSKWINNINLSDGHLDYYYYYFAGFLALNFIYFLLVSRGNNHYRPVTNIAFHKEIDAKVEPLSEA